MLRYNVSATMRPKTTVGGDRPRTWQVVGFPVQGNVAADTGGYPRIRGLLITARHLWQSPIARTARVLRTARSEQGSVSCKLAD